MAWTMACLVGGFPSIWGDVKDGWMGWVVDEKVELEVVTQILAEAVRELSQ